MAELKYDAVRTMKGITVTVKATRATELKWRLWLGVRLFHLAAWVMNCKLEIEGRHR